MIDANNLQLFTVRDAAKLLDMSEHTIRRLIKQRKLPVVRLEQRVMVTRSLSEINALMSGTGWGTIRAGSARLPRKSGRVPLPAVARSA